MCNVVQRVRIAETYGMTGLEPFCCKVCTVSCYKFKSKNLKQKKAVLAYVYILTWKMTTHTTHHACKIAKT